MELTFRQAIESIAADQRSGAAQVAERAADILLRRATVDESSSPEAFRKEILATGWGLIRAQPAMAPLVNLVNTILWKIAASESLASLRQAVVAAAQEFKRRLRQHASSVAEGTLGLIGEGSKIVTLSNSGTIQHALIHAQRAGRRLEVICAESRPGHEGREAAAFLAHRGVPVTLMLDEDAVAAIRHADLVLVGADMLTNRGLVNKAGTHAMAIAARDCGTPFYTLCGSEKFMPPEFHPINHEEWLVEDVWSDTPRGVNIHNAPYDFTPLEAIAGIVTEEGILPIAAVEAWLAAIRLHPALAAQTIEEGR
ncbi:MAG TPA: translation initiation factor eIF-2B [Roseiflexaceae bacterium]